MNAQRQGFTLVELMLVALLGAVIMGAAVQALITQERTYRTTGEIIRGQDGLRTALGVLESELREVATDGGSIGASDIIVATRDSVVFRAQRKLAFVCEVSTTGGERRMWTWSLSDDDKFAAQDAVLVFNDNEAQWRLARVHQVQAADRACPSRPGVPIAHQRVDLRTVDDQDLPAGVLTGITVGAPVRGLHHVTYGIYQVNGEWVLGRRDGPDAALGTLVTGLAGPGEGLVFEFLDGNGALLSATGPGGTYVVSQVRSIRVNARTQPRPGSGARAVELSSTIFLRNN